MWCYPCRNWCSSTFRSILVNFYQYWVISILSLISNFSNILPSLFEIFLMINSRYTIIFFFSWFFFFPWKDSDIFKTFHFFLLKYRHPSSLLYLYSRRKTLLFYMSTSRSFIQFSLDVFPNYWYLTLWYFKANLLRLYVNTR